MVAGLGQRKTRCSSHFGDDRGAEAGRCVDTGADRRAAQRQLGQPGQAAVQALHAVPHLGGVAAELLPQRDRGGVHQVRAAGLHDRGEGVALALQCGGQVLQCRDEVVHDGRGGGDVDAAGEDVVARLAGVDVVVRVDRTAEALGGEGREDLVDVHVRRGAAAGLEDVDREVRVPAAVGHLGGRVLDRRGHVGRQHAEVGVDLGGR